MRRWCCSLLLALWPLASMADAEALQRVLMQQPSPDRFEMCHGGGCAESNWVAISPVEWQQVAGLFFPVSKTAAQERQRIANAIGVMETIVGAKTGTSSDRGGTFGNSAYPGQLDCNDEAANSTTYMKLLLEARLIRFHQILDTKTRGYFVNGWPHTTAAIEDIQSKQRYAVDSWFYDNGQPAVVLPLEVWQSGWKPGNSAAH